MDTASAPRKVAAEEEEEDLGTSFDKIVSLININMSFLGMSFSPDSAPSAISASAVFVGSWLYMAYLVNCISESRDLTVASEVMFHIPWMIQYSFKSANVVLQYDLAGGFLRWAREILTKTHPHPVMAKRLHETTMEGLRMARKITIWNCIYWKSPFCLYCLEWLLNDEVLFFHVSKDDTALPGYVKCVNIAVQPTNAFLINQIALGYNAFVFLWCIFILCQLKRISVLLGAIGPIASSQADIRAVLVDCHGIHVDALMWKRRLEKYMNFVGVVEMATYAVMICFLLYLTLDPETRNPAIAVIMSTAIYQAWVLCFLGQELNTEVETMRTNLYRLPWTEFDAENRRLVYMMIVGTTPFGGIRVGCLEVNLQAFAKLMKLCLSFTAVIRAV